MNRNASFSSGSILDRIVDVKKAEVAGLRRRAAEIRAAAGDAALAPDFRNALADGQALAVIAEVKRRSPSAGEIRVAASAADVAEAYEAAGASAVSVLTDAQFFGGELEDLRAVAERVRVPLLRKDFTIDELQIHEARAVGAAAVLLIVRILDDAQLRDYRQMAEGLGMAALVEVHDERELERAVASDADIIGVNNRNLATFETDLAVTERLGAYLPAGSILISESGIGTVEDAVRVAAAGASAVLVGESLMRAADSSALLRELAGVSRERR